MDYLNSRQLVQKNLYKNLKSQEKVRNYIIKKPAKN